MFQLGLLLEQNPRRSNKHLMEVRSTWAKFANLSSKIPTFKMGLKEDEPALIHVIQAAKG